MSARIDLSGLPNITNDVYVPYYYNVSRYLVLYGGAGSGKSVFVAQKIVFRLLTESNHRFLVVRKVEKTLRDSARDEIIGAIKSMGVDHLFHYSESPTGEMTIKCPNNSTIIFRGLDNKEKMKSIKDVTAIWIEEASELTLDDFTQLDLRLRGEHLTNYKQIILSFNPISSTHWLKVRFFDNKDANATILHTTYMDNRFIDSEYVRILESLKITNKTYYDIYALGKWGVLKGLIYTDYKIIDSLPKDAEIHRYGLDFGFNHPMALTEIMIDGNNLYIDEVFYRSEATTSEMIRTVKQTHPHIMSILGRADAAEPDRIKELRSAGFNVTKAIKNVAAGIDKVKSYNIYVTKNSTNIINEFNLYSWKLDKADNPLDEPIKLNDDAMDSIRYAVFTEKPLQIKPTLNTHAFF
ncbi:PBSX family phage terminase large subunit [Sulfurovum sp. XTW-4]|uniref:PBSX family phage terminase large subunit n=1 Tax=Sulfurovum xiamenensis TaxID=3019066 RepID=A0ABT7QUD0_9BACT|nr:PBSX family phage terminase large subunit [Sulfurovum xiamenensis]MDM5264690.1 PBSX family phage terminase large subunit [Sulfurovum xiamenensis]